MTYELAKQLKDAGFPQENSTFWWVTDARDGHHELTHYGEGLKPSGFFGPIASPILEELIEAIDQLTDSFEIKRYADKSGWHVKLSPTVWESKPELDVACTHLWLALKKVASE